SRTEGIALARQVLAEAASDDDPEDLLEDLFERKLIFERGHRIRSRFAETVRLLVRLKQLFPGRSWQDSPRLVADFRIDRRARRYPKRDQSPEEVWKNLPANLTENGLKKKLWESLTRNDSGNPLPLARF